MTVQIEWQRPAFDQAWREVVDVHDELRRAQQTLSRQAAELFGAGWSGAAAAEYEQAWREWEHGVESVLGSLSGLVAAMDDAAEALAGADGSVAEQVRRRLGERL